MKSLKWLCVLLIPILMSFFVPHPIYVTVTEIDYKKDNKRVEVAMKVFTDDLSKVLSESKGETIEIGTDREHEKATEYLLEYLREHFVFELNGKPAQYNYVTRKIEKSDFFAMWILLEIPKVRNLKSLKLRNDVLMDFYSEQQNLINFREVEGAYQKYMLTQNKKEIVLK